MSLHGAITTLSTADATAVRSCAQIARYGVLLSVVIRDASHYPALAAGLLPGCKPPRGATNTPTFQSLSALLHSLPTLPLEPGPAGSETPRTRGLVTGPAANPRARQDPHPVGFSADALFPTGQRCACLFSGARERRSGGGRASLALWGDRPLMLLSMTFCRGPQNSSTQPRIRKAGRR